jgi:hypothetical protein
MKKWEIEYFSPNAGASHALSWTIEASKKSEAENLFREIYPLEKIISINEINQ